MAVEAQSIRAVRRVALEAELGEEDVAPARDPAIPRRTVDELAHARHGGHGVRVAREGLCEDRSGGVVVVWVDRDAADRELARVTATLPLATGTLEGTHVLVQAQRGEERVERRADGRRLAEKHAVAHGWIGGRQPLPALIPQPSVLPGRPVHSLSGPPLDLREQIVLEIGLVPQRVEDARAAVRPGCPAPVAAGNCLGELPVEPRAWLPVARLLEEEVAAGGMRAAVGVFRSPVGKRRRKREIELQAVAARA